MLAGKNVPLVAVVVGLAMLLAPVHAGVVKQITDVKTSVAGPGALDDAGSLVLAGTSADYGANPLHTFQIVSFDPVTGLPTVVTSAPDGASALVSVSDDGQWLAFVSPTDLTGQNHDESSELFVMAADGSSTTQITSDPAPNAGSVSAAVISGDGSRVLFAANTDPLGLNADQNAELFIVDRQGTNLAQLTQTLGGSLGGISLSDDATRVVFAHSADLTGGNGDLGDEVFAINADGTGLRQLTSTPLDLDSGAPAVSGDGSRVAFQSNGDLTGGNASNQTEIFVVDWAGTGLAQLTATRQILGLLGEPASEAPSITDDGQTVVYQSNDSSLFPTLNIDGNFEIFRIGADGTGLTALTNTILELGSLLPAVSGSGNRVAYYGIDSDLKLQVMDGSGGAQRDLLVMDLTFYGALDLTPDGSRAVFVRSTGLFGGDQVYRVETDGSDLAQVTALAEGGASSPSIAADGTTIVFSADSDPDGTSNSDLSAEIFRVAADGTGLVQLTSGPADTSSDSPVIAASGARVVFESTADLAGTNADLSRELFAMDADGTDLVQLTDSGLDGTAVISRSASVDAGGVWVGFESSADLDGGNPDGTFEIFRVRTDGTGLQRITGDPVLDSGSPDISGDGSLVVFASTADPLGSNPEGNSEIFLFDAATSTLTQLTSFAEGGSGGPSISGSGAWVYFSSNAPIFEDDPDAPTDFYRLPAAGGSIERVGALRRGALGGLALPGTGGGAGLVPDDSGEQVVFTGLGDFTEENLDLLPEIWFIDGNAVPAFDIGRPAPTLLSWTHNAGPLRYDVIRGNVSALGDGAGGTIDLGPVACLEDDSPDADTAGFEDPAVPLPGQAFFYLYRGTQGLLDGPGSYGTSDDGRERGAASGDCAP